MRITVRCNNGNLVVIPSSGIRIQFSSKEKDRVLNLLDIASWKLPSGQEVVVDISEEKWDKICRKSFR